MATKPKKYLYQIQYSDNTYRLINLTKQEWASVSLAIEADKRVCMLDEAVFVLTDIRAIVFIPEEESEEKTEEEKEEGLLSEYGFAEPEVLEWLRENGVDPTKGGAIK